MFSPKTLDILRKAGWSESRHVDTSADEAVLRENGYPVHGIQKEFLSHYSGLFCAYESQHHTLNFHFGVSWTVGHSCLENIIMDSKDIGASLSLIGERASGNYLLAMTVSGKVYQIFDEYIDLVGDSGEDAIEGMCTGRPVKPWRK